MKKIIFTNHALERASERLNFSKDDCLSCLASAVEIELPPGIWGKKFQTYGFVVTKSHYLYNTEAQACFSIIEKNNCYLVLTISNEKYKKPHLTEDGLKFNIKGEQI